MKMYWGLLAFGSVVLLIAFVVVVAPLLLLWALNTLFEMEIPFTLKTWAAAMLLSAPFSASSWRKRQ